MDMMENRRRVLIGSRKKERLPNEYQEVEYIESTGTQYIDTGYVPNLSTKTRVIASFPTSAVSCIVGALHNTGYDIAGWGLSAKKWFMRAFTDGAVKTSAVNKSWVYSSGFHVFETDAENHYMSVDGIGEQRTAQNASNFSRHLYLFCRNEGSTIKYTGNGCTIKEVIFTENDVEVRNFVPCYRKSDGEIGMYDTVSKTFFTNQGTGTFLKGVDV